MPLQKVTIEVDVPEGYEATGEWRWPRTGEPALTTTGRAFCAHADDECGRRGARIILRKLPDPVEEWLAQHSWLPVGRWVYRHHGGYWWITDKQPEPHRDAYDVSDASYDIGVEEIARVFGHTFTPPPVDCLQVKRTKPCN